MMHLIVECGVDPVLNDDTQEKPDDKTPEEEVDVYENSGHYMIMRGSCCAELVWKCRSE